MNCNIIFEKKIMKNYLFTCLIAALLIGCAESKSSSKRSENTKTEKRSEENFETEIVLNSDDTMRFDKNMLLVESGKKITLTLNHNGKLDKLIMGHNFVLLKQGVEVSSFAQMAATARDSEYIPEGDDVIVHTKMLGGGESDTISFIAPDKGFYTFICSFPGHWGLMKGKLIVK